MPIKKRREDISKTNARTPRPEVIRNRNRPGVSGLDPMDTYREQGYMRGLFLRNLFTGRLRTRNPWLLAMMIGGGFLFTCLLTGIVDAMVESHRLLPEAVCFIPLGTVGPALLFNAAINLIGQEQAK